MGNRYWVKRANFTPANTTDDVITLLSAANRRLRVLGIFCNGAGASSAPQGITASRVTTAGITSGGGITPDKADHNDQPAAAFTTATTWSTQPVINTNGITLSFNALGGYAPWQATQLTRGVLEARNGEQISLRPTAGPTPQAQSISVLVEED
jgi:hypothetical protein